jgi:hypothetical protein
LQSEFRTIMNTFLPLHSGSPARRAQRTLPALALLPLSSFAAAQLAQAAPQPRGGAQAQAGAGMKPVVVDAAGQRVVKALEKALRANISSPSGKVKLVIRPTARASQGYFSEISIVGRPAKVRKLQISEVDLRARGVRIDVGYLFSTGKVRTLNTKTSLRAVVTDADLTRLLAQGKRTRDMGLRVAYIGGDRMRVSGNLNYTLLNGPVTGVARLKLAADKKVNLDIVSLQLRGREVPGFLKNQLMGRVNPVIDYEDLPFRPQFRSITFKGNKATLSA